MDDCIYITDDENPQDEDVEIIKQVVSKDDDSPIIIEAIDCIEPLPSQRPPRHQPPTNHHHHQRHHQHHLQNNRPSSAKKLFKKPRSQSPTSSPKQATGLAAAAAPPPSSPSGPKCTICLTVFAVRKQEGFKIIVTKCGHFFCDICIQGSIKALGRKCPKCRKAIGAREKFIEVFDF